MSDVFVYAWFDDGESNQSFTGKPFYVGIGDSTRIYSAKDRNPFCSRKRKKAELANQFRVEILASNLEWSDAADLERKLIAEFGRRDNSTGCLTNLTDGGEGTRGRSFSKETLEKMRQWVKGRGLTTQGLRHRPETIQKMSEAKKGTKHKSSTIQKISEAAQVRTKVACPYCSKQVSVNNLPNHVKTHGLVVSRQPIACFGGVEPHSASAPIPPHPQGDAVSR